MLTVVGSRSERVDEELFYFINADESTDISQATKYRRAYWGLVFNKLPREILQGAISNKCFTY